MQWRVCWRGGGQTYFIVALENPCHLQCVNTGLNCPYPLNIFTGAPIIEWTRVEAITVSSVHDRRQVGGHILHSNTCMCEYVEKLLCGWVSGNVCRVCRKRHSSMPCHSSHDKLKPITGIATKQGVSTRSSEVAGYFVWCRHIKFLPILMQEPADSHKHYDRKLGGAAQLANWFQLLVVSVPYALPEPASLVACAEHVSTS